MSSPRPAEAREAARDILDGRRYQDTDVPRPFRGVLEEASEGVRRAFEAVDDLLPGGSWLVWTLLALGVLVLATLLARRAVERRDVLGGPERRRGGETMVDPGTLEREAAEAERRGELEQALRLRFRAGLIRLDRARRIVFRESLTSGEVARRLRSAEFERVARVFDEVVYGRRPPVAADVELSRDGWVRVLAEPAR